MTDDFRFLSQTNSGVQTCKVILVSNLAKISQKRARYSERKTRFAETGSQSAGMRSDNHRPS